LFDPEYIDVKHNTSTIKRAFWDGSILNNSPLRELIRNHRALWWSKTGSKYEIPDLEMYTISAWPSKINDVPSDYDGIKASLNAITSNGKLNYDKRVAQMVTDYTNLVRRLIALAKKKGALHEIDNILDNYAISTHHSGRARKYKDLIANHFSIRTITINREAYLDDISNQWADFSSDTIDMLIKEGLRDAGSAIDYWSDLRGSTKTTINISIQFLH
jgi:predicted acylesterase/phospholipase RssA